MSRDGQHAGPAGPWPPAARHAARDPWRAGLGALIAVAGLLLSPRPGACADWPTWGGRSARNMVCREVGLPDLRDVANVRWQALRGHRSVRWRFKLSGCTYDTPTVAGGSDRSIRRS